MSQNELYSSLEQAYAEDADLRRAHNENGAKYRQGKISWSEWSAFKSQWQRDHIANCEEIGTIREQLADLAETIDTQKIDSKAVQFSKTAIYPASFVSNISRMHYLLALERKFTEVYDINDEKFMASKEAELYEDTLKKLRELRQNLRGG